MTTKLLPWCWFHTFEAGEIKYQGYVVAILPNGDLRVQLFSFADGAPTTQHVWLRDELPKHNMVFYASAQEMRAAFEKGN